MAYASVISLKQTITRLVCCQSPIYLSHGETLHSALKEALSVQEILESSDSSSSISSERLDDLDGKICKAVNKLEDVLEMDELKLDSSEVCSWQEINCITGRLKMMKEAYVKELDYPAPEDGRMTMDCLNLTKIGDPHSGKRYENFSVFSLTGLAGTCRTILARSVFDDPEICLCFERRAWVTVSKDYDERGILGDIDKQLSASSHSDYESKCLIVLDDVHDTRIYESVKRQFGGDACRILLTTSLKEIGRSASISAFNIYTMSILNEEQSWDLLCKLLSAQLCPPQLEKAGSKVAENCKGLSLEIFKAALSLSKSDKTPPPPANSALEDAYDEMSEISKVTEDVQSCYSCHGGDAENDVSSIITEVLVLSYAVGYIKMNLFPVQPNLELKTVSLFGMAGVGKTTRARKIFESSSHFDHRVWVTLGPKYRPERLMIDILAQINLDIDKMRIRGVETFNSKKCLIVLDDVWSQTPWCYLNNLFPGTKLEIWLTTRLKEVAQVAQSCHEIPLLDNEQSWRLLREQVFGDNVCPPELEKAGRLIADNCDGLPLMIVTVASLLLEAEMTPDYWNKVAKKENSLFERAYDKIFEVLYPSYQYLPQHLKPCFLYMGIFPQNYEFATSKLFESWNYDRILEPTRFKTVEHDAEEYLEKLVSKSLLLVGKKNYSSKIKTCRLHSVFLYLCVREARRIRFFHVLSRCVDGLAEDIKIQRRLCIQNNVLFGIKATHESMASVATARSLLCTDQPLEYPVPICLGLRLLRVLDGLTIRLYVFPIEIPNLLNLRYLAFTYDGKLPPFISKLKNLECLIVRRHICTTLCVAPLYLPMEIWDMQKLKHLQVMGSILPEPCGAVLPNLSVLLDVSARSCTKGVLQGTCNLRKLGIRIELAPNASSKPVFSFDLISHLDRLESLKFVVVNPELTCEVAGPPAPLSMFSSCLIKLSLSGIGYPWEYMREVALIPFLEVLKLRCYAFQGPKWVMGKGEFKSLRYLLLEDSDLVCWRVDDGCFPLLEHVSIRHCYKLEVIPAQILDGFSRFELIDCHPLALKHIKDVSPESSLKCTF